MRTALARAVAARHRAEAAILDAVIGERLDGATWGAIGDELGVSKQAARQRYDAAVRAYSSGSGCNGLDSARGKNGANVR